MCYEANCFSFLIQDVAGCAVSFATSCDCPVRFYPQSDLSNRSIVTRSIMKSQNGTSIATQFSFSFFTVDLMLPKSQR